MKNFYDMASKVGQRMGSRMASKKKRKKLDMNKMDSLKRQDRALKNKMNKE